MLHVAGALLACADRQAGHVGRESDSSVCETEFDREPFILENFS